MKRISNLVGDKTHFILFEFSQPMLITTKTIEYEPKRSNLLSLSSLVFFTDHTLATKAFFYSETENLDLDYDF